MMLVFMKCSANVEAKHLGCYRTYANEIHYQIDHDFRNLTKLVWHFYDFSMIYYEFCKIPVLIEKEKD